MNNQNNQYWQYQNGYGQYQNPGQYQGNGPIYQNPGQYQNGYEQGQPGYNQYQNGYGQYQNNQGQYQNNRPIYAEYQGSQNVDPGYTENTVQNSDGHSNNEPEKYRTDAGTEENTIIDLKKDDEVDNTDK